ncbi:DUF6603 domain-containing protein [Mucilaginibacter gotjawali]|uniref:Uncharacterized protein n=2 Tax=Mucilaginibacter gotjawali TaxID=1550579 RepID=A0A839S794_9SPHI|nr:DUF6603 domain-containing protein [Mucilaginibacter gotjawali]MBB3053755.1 hypothetical protein [Mucilaginibacter gotjawali]BAU54015.1 hypothetical protein MgSA37_02186 [Mucilaginibacter gotjawali]
MTILGPDSINPVAMQIGTLIGLFTKVEDEYVFNNAWFNDPWSYISAIPANPEMFELLGTLMTSAQGTAVGTPRQALNRTWYPILNPIVEEGGTPAPTGIYIVASQQVKGKPTELGVGALYEWKYDDFSMLPYAYFPILKLPTQEGGSFEFILGDEAHPVETGINITGSNGVFNTGNGIASLSFDGFQAASQIYFVEGKYPSLDLTFLNLKLPGEKQGSNRSLFDLIQNASVQQSITVALSVLGSQLSQLEGGAGTAGKMVNSVLELLGLLGPVPGIDWDALVRDPANVVKIFTDWLQNITSNNATLKAWLNDWYCLFKGLDATEDKSYVTGDGTRVSPFSANLLSAKFTETLSVDFDLTFATQQTPEGELKIYPGFSVASSAINPIESMPEFGVKVLASAEVLCYTMHPKSTNQNSTISFFPQYSVMASAANTVKGKPLFAVNDTFGAHELAADEAPAGFSIGSMEVGFIYDAAIAASKIPSPNFRLHDVQTAIGSWPLIDLSNFNVETIEKAIGPIVSAAITAFFGENNAYAKAFTAVFGIDPPSSYVGEWPLKDKMLLSPNELALLIKNPFAAIGAYYSRCLNTNGDGKPLFKYLVPDFSTLLGSESDTVVGEGTEKLPWLIPILKVGTATINLALWEPAENQLGIAFDFVVPMPFTFISATFDLHAAMMVMQLPGNDGAGTWNAAWMQTITGTLVIKDADGGKLMTPQIGGVSIAATDVYVTGGWKNNSSFFVVAGIDNLQLNSSIGTIVLGDIEFSTVGWDVEQLKKFTPAIVNGLGLLMLENGGTVGVLITTTLGLLPNLPQIFDGQEHPEYNFPIPEYLIIPQNWPVISIDNYTNPWIDVVNQLSALYSGSEFMVPLMQMIGWGITGIVPGAPDIIPAGTLADPWNVSIPDVFGIDLLTYIEDSQAGYGVRKLFNVNATESVQIATILRADVPGVMLNGATGPTNNYPGISFINVIQNPNVTLPLIDEGGLFIDKVQLGAFLQLQNGQLVLIPVLRFVNSRLKDTEILRDIELIPVPGKPQFTANDAIDAFNSLINAMMEKLSATIQAEGFTQLQAFLDILALYRVVDIVIDEDTKLKTYSFNPGAWASILSNPGGYLFTQTTLILQNEQPCADLVKSLAQLLGYTSFNLPAAWQGIQYLLQSLELAKDYNGFYIPVFDAWLALFKDPVGYLQNSVSHLFNTPALIKQLVTNVATLVTLPKGPGGVNLEKYFSVDTSGTILTIQVPTDKIVMIGDEIQLFADLVIDVNAYTLTNSIALGSRTLDSSLAFNWTPSFTGGHLSADYGFYLTGIPHTPQAFPPLPLWPFPADTQKYLQQIGFQVPMTLLSSFSVKYVNDFVVPQNPAVINIFKVLGLTSTVEGTDLVKPLTGIFMNPLQWLLTPEVLGNGTGGVDLSKLGGLLYAITDAAGIKNGSIELKAYEHDGKKDGVELTGLPWGVSFIVFANTLEGANLRGNFKPALPSPAPNINLTAGVAFGTPNGVGIDGSISMSYDLGEGSGGTNNTFGITAAYAKKGFVLSAKANANEYLLLPWGGFNQFLNEGTAGTLLTIIGDKLFGAYHEYVLENPGTPLEPFVRSIEILTKIVDGATLFNFFNAIYQDPLGQFTEANITVTLPRINEFLTTILTLEGFSISSDEKLLVYEHTFASFPGAKVVINIGLRTVEGVTIFGLWLQPVATYSWMSLGLVDTGVGIVMPVNYDSPDLRYEVNIAIGTNFSSFNIPNVPEPTLVFGLNGDLKTIHGPNLKFYPVTVSDAAGTLQIEILPTAQLLIAGRSNVTTEQWMINFGVEFLIPFMANTALGVKAVKDWLDLTKIGNVVGIPGKVLVDWGLLEKTGGNYYLSNLREAFDLNDPIEIVTKLIFSALNLLDGQRVVPIKDHGIYVQSETEGTNRRYGVRIQITDIEVTSSLNSDGAKLLFQLGKYYADQDKNNNWTGLKSDPGFVVYFINRDTANDTMTFLPKFDLVSVGLDFAGANAQKPLINTKGVTIQSIEPRVYVSLDLNGNLKTDFGAGIMLYNLGVPLGPGFDKPSSNTNPVAQNLLTGGGDPGKTDAINPAFSVAASYVYNSQTFTLQLYDSKNLPADKVWISIMRAFGPLQVRKVGIGWKGSAVPKRLDFLFDGQVSLAGLMANLVELDIGIPITDPTNFGEYSLDLAGLDVSYNAGAVSIGGGFLKDDSAGYIQYTGQAKIQTAAFGIGAFGAYALIEGHPSLFIFAYLNAPLGGPPYFFINGLSGGFGYNRTINIPPAKEIENFPFVAGIENPAALGGKDGKAPTNEEALKTLGTKTVPPQLGSYWVAAGIMFASFELINSKAVLMVIFGNDFEIALLGLSGMVLPKKGKTYVGAQIAFKVTYKVSTGLLAMEAVLTSNSYVIDSNCRLTGGLAFFVWFKNQTDSAAKAGEFVFTLGGYHPAFKKPDYFPDEPRLGFSWAVGGGVSIKGGAYFALTPSAVMAGGSLEAVYQSGNLKAWFTAYADFLIMWNPFYYDIRVGVSVGASYTVKFIWTTTFKVELGADVHIWGPEMAGSATVHWWVISFTVNFGATNTRPNTTNIIEWGEFKPYFLPSDQAPAVAPQQQPQPQPDEKGLVKRTIAPAPQETIPVQQVSHIKQTAGLIKEIPNPDPAVSEKSPVLWQITADGFAFTVSTVVPLNKITITGVEQPITSDKKFGIRPMGNVVFGTPGQMSELTFTVKYNNDIYKAFQNWNFNGDLNGIPESLWGTTNDGKTAIDAKIIPDALVGLSAKIISSSDNLPVGGPPMFPLSNLGYAAWPWRKLTLANNPHLHPSEPAKQSDQSLIIIEDTVMAVGVVTVREMILNAIVSAGINVVTDGRLDQMAAYASATFQSFPMLGELGSLGYQPELQLAAIPQTFHRSKPELLLKAEPREFAAPLVRAVAFQYAGPELPSTVFMAASTNDVKMTRPVKGKMFSYDNTQQWMVDAVKQGTNLRASGAEGLPEFTIYPGVSVIVDFDPDGPASLIKLAGNDPVFACWFDQYNQLLGSEVLSASKELPAGVAQLILSGLNIEALKIPYAYGWYATSELTLVNPNSLIGMGAVIAPDAPVRVKTRISSEGYGLIQGQGMIKVNRIMKDGVSVPAGVKTIMPSDLKTVAAIALKKDLGMPFNSDSISLEIKVLTGNIPEYRKLTPAKVIDGSYEAAVLFEVPGDTGYNYNVIYTTSDAQTTITGVMGLTEEVKYVEENWKDIVIQPALPYPYTWPQPTATITIETI